MGRKIELKKIGIYHSEDFDGVLGGYIISNFFADIKMIPLDYNKEFKLDMDQIDDDTVVIFVDCHSKDYIKELVTKSRRVILLDHHLSTAAWLAEHYDFIKAEPGIYLDNKFTYIYDDKISAAEVTWQYFYPNDEMPIMVETNGIYDSWRHDNEKKYFYFQYGLMARNDSLNPYNKKLYNDTLLHSQTFVDSLIKDGESIYNFKRNDLKSLIDTYGFEFRLDGYKCMCVNGYRQNPGNFDLQEFFDAEIFISYYYYKNNWIYSIYSIDKRIDVSKIATKRNGGGHKNAARFNTNYNIFEK